MSCFISFEGFKSSCEEHGTSELYLKIVYSRIRDKDNFKNGDEVKRLNECTLALKMSLSEHGSISLKNVSASR